MRMLANAAAVFALLKLRRLRVLWALGGRPLGEPAMARIADNDSREPLM